MIPWLYDLMVPDFIRIFLPTAPVMVRSVGAFILSFLVVFLAGRRVAALLYRRGFRDRVRDYDSYFSHSKTGTPTMGGILIVAAITVGATAFCDLESGISGLMVLTTLWYGGLGVLDDLLKVRRQSSDGGMSRSLKILLQLAFAAFFALMIGAEGSSPFSPELRTRLIMPFPAEASLDLGLLYPFFVVFAIVAITNAINFADGLDGLAVLPSAMTAAVFGFFAYLSWNVLAAKTFGFAEIDGIQDVAIFAAAVVGACFGFLWFNGYPAQMFMGDTGSQALGGSLAAIAVLSKQELLFLIAGGIFVFEAFSVLFQDYVGIRWLGRRFFFRAPAHHSYQHQGLAETKVVLRFWIVSLLCAVLSVATLKLR
ncbi:MAG: phospho-N-acetylmuramoyl-pentapeptide-transferase [Planctomycetes bacterium]|nr:phospho-N-acetylmuramoyl-pentapeptide-transferase [Planctomycetota bacterium]